MITIARSWLNNLNLEYQLLLGVVMFNIIDFITTKDQISKFGVNVELNPFLNMLITHYGTIWSILFIKVIVLTGSWTAIYKFYKPTEHKMVIPTLIFVLVCYISVSIHNLILVIMT